MILLSGSVNKRLYEKTDRIFNPGSNTVKIDNTKYGFSHYILRRKWDSIIKEKNKLLEKNNTEDIVAVRTKARLVLYKIIKFDMKDYGIDEEELKMLDLISDEEENNSPVSNESLLPIPSKKMIKKLEIASKIIKKRIGNRAIPKTKSGCNEAVYEYFEAFKIADGDKIDETYERTPTIIHGTLELVFDKNSKKPDEPVGWEFYANGKLIHSR